MILFNCVAAAVVTSNMMDTLVSCISSQIHNDRDSRTAWKGEFVRFTCAWNSTIHT